MRMLKGPNKKFDIVKVVYYMSTVCKNIHRINKCRISAE